MTHANPARMRFEIGDFSDARRALERAGRTGKLGHNTWLVETGDGGVGVKLHNTIIVTYYPDRIVLNSGGYLTATTKARINEVLPPWAKIVQKRHEWFLVVKDPLIGGEREYDFEDGMTIPTLAHGSPAYGDAVLPPSRNPRRRDVLRTARRMGREAGKNAASWVEFDDAASARHVLQGIEDGDPEILDAFQYPNLSGEWAGDPTPQSLAEDLDIDDPDTIDDAATAWEEGVSETFLPEIERRARLYAK